MQKRNGRTWENTYFLADGGVPTLEDTHFRAHDIVAQRRFEAKSNELLETCRQTTPRANSLTSVTHRARDHVVYRNHCSRIHRNSHRLEKLIFRTFLALLIIIQQKTIAHITTRNYRTNEDCHF